jgi:phosphoglycolate phosphatase-like HAD superfamily hydrolase
MINMSSGEKKKLVLFDVDHTLLVCVNAHWTAYTEAFKKVYDVKLPTDFPPWHGYTDLQIIYSLMDMLKLPIDESKAQKIMQVMVEVFLKQDLSDSRLLVGVEDILVELKTHKNIIIGLVTGNIEAIAYAKLKHLKIDEYFVLGGFGNISAIRSDLVKDAIRKAEEKFGKIDKKDVFVIGDTIGDIAAARGAGTKVISVCTGDQTMEILNSKNPDYLFKNLSDTKKVLEVIKNE